jgi:dihydroorotate dehydrogenase electron transfer subunit
VSCGKGHRFGAAYYADQAVCERASILNNDLVAEATYRIQVDCREIARRILPGQFVMVRTAQGTDPLLGRPMALFDTLLDAHGEPCGMEIVFQVVGRMTALLAASPPGTPLELWGPLGNGFGLSRAEHLVMVAGGIGQTPFLAVAREAFGQRRYGLPSRAGETTDRITLCYGVRSGPRAACVQDFIDCGVEVRLATEDGSAGFHGRVTDVLREVLLERCRGRRIVCCGPEPMMESVSRITRDAGVPCEVSLETPMACGIGICFSCVARVRQQDGAWDYRRVCVDGPVFDADSIVWSAE